MGVRPFFIVDYVCIGHLDHFDVSFYVYFFLGVL